MPPGLRDSAQARLASIDSFWNCQLTRVSTCSSETGLCKAM